MKVSTVNDSGEVLTMRYGPRTRHGGISAESITACVKSGTTVLVPPAYLCEVSAHRYLLIRRDP